jgi:hypothetical protein
MFWHKYEARLAKDISTLASEADMLEPGERNKFNEDRESIRAELELMKRLAGEIEKFTQKRMREAIDRMSLLKDEKPRRRTR